MKIQVTTRDITKANKLRRKRSLQDAERCPIACAFKRIIKRDDVLVGTQVVHIGFVSPHKVYRLPHKATDFIRKYDQKCSVEPFSFNAIKIKTKK